MQLRVNPQAQATVPATGNTVFTLPAPPLGQVWTTSVVIPASGDDTIWTATIGTLVWASWTGNSPSTPIQQTAGLPVTVSGLVQKTAGTVLTAYLIGRAEDASAAAIITPTQSQQSSGSVVAKNIASVTVTGPGTTNVLPFNATGYKLTALNIELASAAAALVQLVANVLGGPLLAVEVNNGYGWDSTAYPIPTFVTQLDLVAAGAVSLGYGTAVYL